MITIPPVARWTSGSPPIKPYQEALAYQQKRTPLLAHDYYSSAMDAARPRAFTITGLTRYSSLLEAHSLGEEAIRSGMSMSDYADRLGEIVDRHGGTVLPPSRFELIHHNTMANNYAAGAWQQMHDPEFLADRPFFQYIGSEDSCPICSPLRGKIVHYTDPLLRHLWPPNHHWCACEWISLAAEDVDPDQVYRTPEGSDYPVIDGRTVRPAEGFDYEPGDVFAADDNAFTRGVAELDLAAGTQLHHKLPADYGLGELIEETTGTMPAWPELPEAISRLSDSRSRFASIFGFPRGAERTIVMDYARDGVWVNADSHAALAAASGEDIFVLAASTLQEPAEVWFVPAVRPNGGTVYLKRYFGTFSRGGEVVAGWVDRSPDGWLMGGGLGTGESQRYGLLTWSRLKGGRS